MNFLYALYDDITLRLRTVGEYIALTLLRLIMFWEFWESGIVKYNGKNWFANVPSRDWQVGFQFPFSQLPAEVSWFMATWGEIVFAVLLLLGLFTRLAAFSLLVITVVAMSAVHWPNAETWGTLPELWQGYAISSSGFGNYKLPLLFMLILMPLIFYGGGKLSVDNLLLKYVRQHSGGTSLDVYALGLAGFIIATGIIYLFPLLGGILLVASLVCIGLHFKNKGF